MLNIFLCNSFLKIPINSDPLFKSLEITRVNLCVLLAVTRLFFSDILKLSKFSYITSFLHHRDLLHL